MLASIVGLGGKGFTALDAQGTGLSAFCHTIKSNEIYAMKKFDGHYACDDNAGDQGSRTKERDTAKQHKVFRDWRVCMDVSPKLRPTVPMSRPELSNSQSRSHCLQAPSTLVAETSNPVVSPKPVNLILKPYTYGL